VTLKLEVGVTQGHQKWHHSVAHGFLVKFYSNCGYSMHRFLDTLIGQKCQIFSSPCICCPIRGEAVI